MNGEPPDETLRYTLKVVHLNELIQVHREHLEAQDKVLSEHKSLDNSHDILLIVRIVDPEFL